MDNTQKKPWTERKFHLTTRWQELRTFPDKQTLPSTGRVFNFRREEQSAEIYDVQALIVCVCECTTLGTFPQEKAASTSSQSYKAQSNLEMVIHLLEIDEQLIQGIHMWQRALQ